MSRGRFKNHRRVMVTYDVKPSPGDMVWIDQTTGIDYNYDSVKKKWLSADKDVFEFARKGNAAAMYIPLLGDLDQADDVYITGYTATIVGVFCRSRSGDDSKTFEVRRNGETLFEFSYNDELSYVNNSLDIDIGPYDEINFYVASGKKVKNTVCRLTIARRYDL